MRSIRVWAVLLLLALPGGRVAADNPKLAFWSVPRHGANQFNQRPDDAWFAAAAALGVDFVRLVPDKWSGEGVDFLIGDCDHFTALVPADLARLRSALDAAEAHHVKIVLGLLSLPGCRWENFRDHRDDPRLWHDEAFQDQAAACWRQLAAALKDHPAIVGYDLLNEPHPERGDGLKRAGGDAFDRWLAAHRGTTADLNAFYRRMLAAIRAVDPATPILLEGYGYGSVDGLAALAPVDDPAVLYSLHFYEPWQFTTRAVNAGRYRYPDCMSSDWAAPGRPWTRADLRALLQPVAAWTIRHGIDRRRIVAAEFGCARQVEGAQAYLADVVRTLDEFGWHWAFYAFREDGWDEMDYELGTGSVPHGQSAAVLRRDTPLFDVLKREFAADRER